MFKLFHINKKGQPKECTRKNCNELHFDSEEEAQKYYEEEISKKYGLTPELNFKYFDGTFNSDEYKVNCDVEMKLRRIINDVNLKEVIEELFEEIHYFFFTYKTTSYFDKEIDMFVKVSRKNEEVLLIESFIESFDDLSLEEDKEKRYLNEEYNYWYSSQFFTTIDNLEKEMVENKAFYETQNPLKATGAIINSLFTMALKEWESQQNK